MGGGDYNRIFLYPVGGVKVVEMVEMMEIVPRNKYTRHLCLSHKNLLIFFIPSISKGRVATTILILNCAFYIVVR